MRRLVSGGVAGILALLLVGAAAGSGGSPSGTAATSLAGVDLTVTGEAPGDVSLVDLTTLATTDPDATPAGPFAEVAVVPLSSGGERIGAARASSEDDREATTAPASLPTGAPLGAGVDAVRLSASASAERASAVAGATAASLSALTDGLGIELDLTGVESLVTAESSSATQRVAVSGFDLALGDLLPLPVLEVLPLDVLLDLVQLLPTGVPDVETLVTDLLDLQELIRTTVTTIETAVADLDRALDDLGALEDAADDVAAASQTLEDLGLSADLIDAIVADPEAGMAQLLSDPDAVSGVGGGLGGDTDGDGTSGDELSDAVDGILGGDDGGDDDGIVDGLSSGTVSAAALTELETGVQQLVTAVHAEDRLQETLGSVETVTETITELVEVLTTQLAELERLLNDVLALLVELEGLLPDLLAALEEGELVAVGDLEVGMTSIAAATVEDSSAEVACGATSVSVVGRSVDVPDCTSAAAELAGTLESALAVVSDVLGSLPIDVVSVPDVSLSLLPEVTERVTEEDGTVTAVAGVTLLELALPSVDLDPAAVVEGVLASLLDGLVAELTGQLPTEAELADLGLAAELDAGIGAVLTGVPELSGLTDQVLAAVGELPLGVDVPNLATPGVEMTMASSSSASFTPGSTAPAPGDDPTLPATGGGMAAIGLLALFVGTRLHRTGARRR